MEVRTTREQLLQFLRIHGPLTAAELAKFLEVGGSAVYQHLDRLRAEGSVEVVGLRRGRGRPKQLFALTRDADRRFPQQYESLALDLLEAISRMPDDPTLLDRVLEARRDMWHERYGPQLADEPLGLRLAALVDILNEKGGLAHYTAREDGTYVLTKNHCSIGAVVEHYPQFCQEERTWLEEVLQSQVQALHSRANGDPYCEFLIVPQPALWQGARSDVTGKGDDDAKRFFAPNL